MSDLLPINATSGERAQANTVARISDVPVPVRSMWDPQSCPASVLPWLAWAFSVDEWSSSWTDAQKRAAIASSVLIHQRKGTIGALKAALATMGVVLTVREWFQDEPPGEPYTFRIVLDGSTTGWSEAQFAKLMDVVMATKNLRSHLAAVESVSTVKGGPWLGGASCVGNEITIQFGGDA